MSLPFEITFVIVLQFLVGLLIFVLREERIKKIFSKQASSQKRRLYELGVFRTIQNKIGYSLSIEHVVDTITSSLKDLFPESIAVSLLVKEEVALLKFYIEDQVTNKFLEDLKARMIISYETLGKTYLQKKIEESRFGIVVGTNTRMTINSFFHIPVVINDNLYGLITVASRKPKAFLKEDIESAYLITKQMTAALTSLEEVIETEEGKLLGMIGSLIDGVFMIDKNFNMTTINPAAKKILGLSEDPTIYQILGILSREYDFKTKIQDAMTSNKVTEDLEMKIGDKTVQIAITPVVVRSKRDYIKQVIGASVRLHDITQEKALAQMKEDFTSSMVHELRAPLTAIKAGSELMLTEKEKLDDVQQEKTLEIIHKQSERMLHDISSLLDAAKLESGHFSINQHDENILLVLAESQQLFTPEADKKHISITLDVDPKIPKAYFDAARIGQVINNLISNALKFTPDGGTIMLHARKFFEEHLPKSETNPGILVSVSDTGIGIPKEKRGGR